MAEGDQQPPRNGVRYEVWKDTLHQNELDEVQRIEGMSERQAVAYSHVMLTRRIDETEQHFNVRVDAIERGHNETLDAARRTSIAKAIGAGVAGGIAVAVPWLGSALGWDRVIK